MPPCEMCGKDTSLLVAEVEGVELKVCSNCVAFGKVRSQHPGFLPSTVRSQPSLPEFVIIPQFPILLRSARESRNMSQEDFAKFLNERVSVVAKWEQGALKPNVEVARKIGKLLKLALVQKEVGDASAPISGQRKVGENFTVGDFIKIRKRH